MISQGLLRSWFSTALRLMPPSVCCFTRWTGADGRKIRFHQVSVAIGLGTCYVKVDDNGSGASRDGLVLMGERYVRMTCFEHVLLLLHCRYCPVGFGNHLSSLNKLNASYGSFKLSGNISGPDDYTVKVYRPRLMDKRCDKYPKIFFERTMHKLLNNTAMSLDSASDIEQRSRSQIYLLFLLNLNCPKSLYDLTLEPSKTSVKFKRLKSFQGYFFMYLLFPKIYL